MRTLAIGFICLVALLAVIASPILQAIVREIRSEPRNSRGWL